jgi:hypothetical protein
MINVRCQWKVRLDAAAGNNAVSSSTNCAISEIDSGNGCENHISWNTHFDNELHFIMRVNASCIPLNAYNNSVERASAATEANDHEENSQKLNRKERSTSRKLRSGMIKRLRADPFIRSLLLDEDKSGAAASDGVLLCEALIQQNSKREHDAKSRSMKCEERVNVNSECIEGIRNAILSHCEDNLDVLEMLLRMPYLPRSDVILNKNEESSSNEKTYQEILQCLSGRALLRILEDAMFDACEKEGEDEMLDDLNISDNVDDEDKYFTERKQQHASRSKAKRV